MKIADLELFVEVARQGGYAVVAKARGVDPSSVSRRVAALERELGIRLFQRTTRKLTLTEAGEIFLGRAQPLLEELAHARDAASHSSQAARGTLRLTVSVAFGQERIVPLLKVFRTSFPSLKLECLFTDTNLDLVAEGIDLAIRLAPTVTGDVVAAKFMETHYRVVASPRYLRKALRMSTPSDISLHRCLLFNLPGYRSRWRFRDPAGRVEEASVDGDIILSTASAIRMATLDGLGPSLLPSWLIDGDLRAKRLIDAFPRHAVTATTFDTAAWFVYPSRNYLPTKVRVAIDFLREHLK
jgi:DNA-binding transcriptional LysR family regulator